MNILNTKKVIKYEISIYRTVWSILWYFARILKRRSNDLMLTRFISHLYYVKHLKSIFFFEGLHHWVPCSPCGKAPTFSSQKGEILEFLVKILKNNDDEDVVLIINCFLNQKNSLQKVSVNLSIMQNSKLKSRRKSYLPK